MRQLATDRACVQAGSVRAIYSILCLSTLLAGSSMPGRAATYYVSPTGSGACAQATDPSTPTSIAQGVDCVQAGDTIIAMDGTYGPPASCAADPTFGTMGLYLAASGAIGNPITLKAMTKWGAILDSGSLCHSSIYFTGTANWWVIENLDIRNGHYGGIYSNDGGGQNIIIRGNHIHNIGQNADAGLAGGAGVYTDNLATMTLDSNLIHDIGPVDSSPYANSYIHGVYSHGNLTVVNNIFYNMWDGWAIQAASGFQGRIANNTFYGPDHYQGGMVKDGQIQLWNQAAGPISIINNIFDQPYRHAITTASFSTNSPCTVDHNLAHLVVGVGPTGLSTYCTLSSNTSSNDDASDPQFVSATIPDFHLRGNSPAIEAGNAFGASTFDFDGSPRPRRAAYDLGAYQNTPGLQAWWRFVYQTNDSSGHGNDAPQPDNATYGPGMDGAAIFLNGAGQYVSVPENGSLDMTDNVTVAFWINASSIPNGTPLVVSKNNSWSIALNAGQSPAFADQSGRYAELDYTVIAGAWVHVAFTFQSSSGIPVTGYINGAPVALATNTFNAALLPAAASGLTIGADSSGSTGFVAGLLGDVRIYDRVLSPLEISQIYSSNSWTPVPSSTPRAGSQKPALPPGQQVLLP